MGPRTGQARGGRPLGFEPEAALDAAMTTFWAHGYEATTTSMLEQATALSRSSLLNTFGTKEELLLAVLDRYQAALDHDLLGPLATGDGLAAVDRFFARLADLKATTPGSCGCLMVNVATQLSPMPPRVQERIDRYRTRLAGALRAALARARATGEIDAHEAEALADVLTALAVAVNWTARAGGTSPAQHVAESARRLIRDRREHPQAVGQQRSGGC